VAAAERLYWQGARHGCPRGRDVIPPDACTLGWQESLILLAKLVEPEIPD
jgi:hypothetical protein